MAYDSADGWEHEDRSRPGTLVSCEETNGDIELSGGLDIGDPYRGEAVIEDWGVQA